MKKIILSLGVLVLAACGNNSNQQQTENANTDSNASNKSVKTTLTIKGSDTVLPLAQKEAEEYMKANTDAALTIVGGGSGVGITALKDGSTDIAMSSRPLKTEEKMEFQQKGMDIKETIIANDALAIIVNPKNKVTKLTHEQLGDIFTGKITNWKQVGGNDAKIVAYARETSSGTYEFFKEHVMDKKNYAASVLNMPATGAIVESVSKTEGAIGYVGLAYETNEVKQIAVSYDKGKTYVEPGIEAAQNGTYPVSRPLYFYYAVAKESAVKPFVEYILSQTGQQIVKEVGYVPLQK